MIGNNIRLLLQSLLRGLGQIMLQPSAATGLLFLCGIASGSPLQAVATLAAAVAGTAYGRYVAPDNKAWLSEGLFGFNAALVGLALSLFFAPSAESLALLVAGAVTASALMHGFLKQGWPAYTAPFVVTAWLFVAVGKWLGLNSAQPVAASHIIPDLPNAPLAGIGQVMFQPEPLAGLFFLLGVIVCPIFRNGWRAGFRQAVVGGAWVFAGSLVAGFAASLAGLPHTAVNAGLYGFNAALAALAVSRLYRSIWAPLLFALLTIPIIETFRYMNLPPFTAPFVLITWAAHLFLLTRQTNS